MKKLLSGILVLIIVACSCVYLVACKDDDTISLPYRIEKYFDLEEEKVYWDGNFTEDSKIHCVYIEFKKVKKARLDADPPIMFPILNFEDLEYDNAEQMVYQSSAPSTINAMTLATYRQTAIVFLKDKGKENVIEAIEYFSCMSIVYYASPYTPQSDTMY